MSASRRRQAGHVAAVFALAVVVRALLFHRVGIWGDAGFYTYDAMLINEGKTPFVDFVGRSPLFNYGYAAFASVVGNGMVTLRAFIVAWWLLTGLPVYAIGRRVGGHSVGLASMAIVELAPFMLVYGYWANTQSMAAFLAASAVAVVLYRRDWWGYAVAGLLLGAAFLARRSVVVIIGAVGLYALWLGWRDRDVRQAIECGGAVTAGVLAALAVGYALMANGDLTLAGKLAETHAWGLLSSQGRGGFPLVTENAPAEPLNRLESGRIPIFNDVCQLCGEWTLLVFAKTILASVVCVAPLLYYARDWGKRLVPEDLHWWASRGALAIAAYGAFVALRAGYVTRVGALLAFVGVGYVVANTRLPDARVLYSREILLPGIVLVALSAGYLYRNRYIHTYYFADFMPYLAVFAGLLYVHLVREVRAE